MSPSLNEGAGASMACLKARRGHVADDEGSLALAFVNPRGGLAAVGCVADDGVEAERTLTVIDPFLCVGTVEADHQRSANRLLRQTRGSPIGWWVRSVVS
jgi:hypothetical protein